MVTAALSPQSALAAEQSDLAATVVVAAGAISEQQPPALEATVCTAGVAAFSVEQAALSVEHDEASGQPVLA